MFAENNLSGMVFGKLKVIEKTRIENGISFYKCECDCGNTCEKSRRYLLDKKSKSKSCGCAQRKDVTGMVFGKLKAIGYTGRSQYGRAVWLFECECKNKIELPLGYVVSGGTWCCGCEKMENKGFEKARKNTCVLGTNIPAIRSKKLSKKNTSGITGVHFLKDINKWEAKIMFQRTVYYLGRYAEREDAISARKKAEEKRDDFLKWYDSLSEKEKEFQKVAHESYRKDFREFCERIRNRIV